MLQGLLRNPLADPGLLGVSSGAAVDDGDREARAEKGRAHVAVAVGVGIALIVLPGVIDRRDLLHDPSEIGVAAGLELDHRDPARRVRDEHGAQPVSEAGVGDGLLRVLGDVDRVVVPARVERDLFVP